MFDECRLLKLRARAHRAKVFYTLCGHEKLASVARRSNSFERASFSQQLGRPADCCVQCVSSVKYTSVFVVDACGGCVWRSGLRLIVGMRRRRRQLELGELIVGTGSPLSSSSGE